MEDIDFFLLIDLCLIIALIILEIFNLFKKQKTDFQPLRDEFKSNREELNNSIQKSREEMVKNISDLNRRINDQLMGMQQGQVQESRSNRKEIKDSLDEFSKKLELLTKETTANLDKVKNTVDSKLQSIQKDNNEKLEKMRQTVDEKLSSTLEKRLGESFSMVSKNLEAVQKGLGEMQALATDVGGLKKVLTNVKTKGIVGELK